MAIRNTTQSQNFGKPLISSAPAPSATVAPASSVAPMPTRAETTKPETTYVPADRSITTSTVATSKLYAPKKAASGTCKVGENGLEFYDNSGNKEYTIPNTTGTTVPEGTPDLVTTLPEIEVSAPSTEPDPSLWDEFKDLITGEADLDDLAEAAEEYLKDEFGITIGDNGVSIQTGNNSSVSVGEGVGDVTIGATYNTGNWSFSGGKIEPGTPNFHLTMPNPYGEAKGCGGGEGFGFSVRLRF